MAADKPIDFDDEARKLWARLNLDPSTKVRGAREWNDLDAIWRDPKTGGTIYVGNQNAAGNLAQLQQHAIARVVNCTSGFSKIKNFHEGKLSYFEFDIARWQLHVDKKDGSVGRFVAPLFEFIDGALAKGESVLVHCLAGAHRAGTTGCACLMWYGKMDAPLAIASAKKLRPIIDPIAQFPAFLEKLNALLVKKAEL